MDPQKMDLLDLPVVMIENIFSYLSYDEIAKNRIVSRTFNEISMRMLNRGFMMIERRHAMALKNVKAQLPRRESERRIDSLEAYKMERQHVLAEQFEYRMMLLQAHNVYDGAYLQKRRLLIADTIARLDGTPQIGYHHLSRHCDILTSIETRISMLNMTYSKFVDNGLCCFIPGKVIDEIKRVLQLVETQATPPRAHEVLQELRDISSMAIEHFDDKISPDFRKRLQQGVIPPQPRPPAAVLAPIALRQDMVHLRRRSILNAKLSLYLANQYKKFYKRMMDYKKVAWRQQKTIRELIKKQREQDNVIADLKKRIEECDIKYSELTHTNQAVGGAIAASAAGDVAIASTSSQPLRHFSSQIKLDLSVLPIGTSKRNNKLLPNMKPRKPLIKLPSLSEDDSGPPPKIQKIDESRLSPAPSSPADRQSPRTRSQSTMAKIRGITDEIRHLTNLSKTFESQLKRPLGLSDLDVNVPDSKKQKLD